MAKFRANLMKNSNKEVTGILLAGGLSKRMGREKGSLDLGGRMMYEYPLKALESVCDEILISGSSPLPGTHHYKLVPDKFKGIGPMGGIHACLERSSNELNLVLSYDLPLIQKDLLSYLLENSASWDLVLPETKPGQPEPLCGFYRKKLQPAFEALIEKKQYAVNRIIPLARSLILPIQENLAFYHPDLFLNLNCMEDLKKLPGDFGKM